MLGSFSDFCMLSRKNVVLPPKQQKYQVLAPVKAPPEILAGQDITRAKEETDSNALQQVLLWFQVSLWLSRESVTPSWLCFV